MGSGRGEAASSSRCRAERTSNPNDGSGRVTSVPARSLNLRAILDDLSPCPPGVVDRLVEVVEVLQSLIDSFLVQQVADRILVKRVNRFLLFVEDSECLLVLLLGIAETAIQPVTHPLNAQLRVDGRIRRVDCAGEI